MNILIILFSLVVPYSVARIHKLEIWNDSRKYIALSTFGFYKGGILDVKLTKFHTDTRRDDDVFGFSLDKTLSDAMNPYLDNHQDKCILEDSIYQNTNEAAVYFTMDFKNKLLRVNCTEKFQMVHIFQNRTVFDAARDKRLSALGAEYLKMSDPRFLPQRRKRDLIDMCTKIKLPLEVKEDSTSTEFFIYVASETEEGLYNLYFHSCPNYRPDVSTKLNFVIEIQENNKGNYLSAGEMPLPALYFTMALVFCVSGSIWVYILSKSKHCVFKIHYLMALLVYLKSLSLLFHGINFHFIQTTGRHEAAWAILYYITHLLKGSVLFIVIVLVGTGWTFIKHILSEKDKKIFMIVIPMQVLANVAEIIIEESEEGDAEHRTWRDIFILVDLLCCGAILMPVVWSIRHLQEASHTDGKAAINLRKLKLFRHFYIMIVCYIYFTRIIVYLLKITVPFQYEWLDEMFKEVATYVFFALTGYKFRPASANPYFQVPSEAEDEDMNYVVSESGLTENLKKVNRVDIEKEGTEEEKDTLISKRESSHDLD